MRRVPLLTLLAALAVGPATAVLAAPAAPGAGPQPGSPAYVARDNQNMADSYGRQTGPNGQLRNPAFLPALVTATNATEAAQLMAQAATPNRPALTPGNVVPGWNMGNPLRAGWAGSRGRVVPVAYTNRYGALIRGHVYAPRPGARDPYTHLRLHAPFPGVVITTGSIQGSEGMYAWLAEDLAERGYVVLTYDVQGQGTSETLPHQGPQAELPYCSPAAKPAPGETTGCPGVPSQQTSNFVFGTLDAISFFLSTPRAPYRDPAAGSARVNHFNPLWTLFDRSPDRRTATPGRTTRLAIVGHSLGATAVSYVQAVDKRVEAVVALDKLTTSPGFDAMGAMKPVVPALGVQSEYFFNPVPYWAQGYGPYGGSSGPPDPSKAPDPARERKTGFDGWTKSGVDSMLIVPRASTHLEYTDIALVLPASRYGQDLTSHYVQAWLGKYLRHDPSADAALLATSFRYLEPVGHGVWAPVSLRRDGLLSFYFCSAWDFRTSAGQRAVDGDVIHDGCR